jgi:RimJ/RimL family protein N-acetyltransferase
MEDRAHVIRVVDEVCAEGKWMHTTCFTLTPSWAHALSQPDCRHHLLLVPRVKKQPIGWCRAFPINALGEVNLGIGLLPPYRDHGFGTYLVRHVVAWAKDLDFARLALTTRFDNYRAIRVFKNCGFTWRGKCDSIWIEMTYLL